MSKALIFSYVMVFLFLNFNEAQNWRKIRRQFLTAYNSPDEATRLEAVKGIGDVEGSEATKLLLQVLDKDKSGSVYKEAIKILSKKTDTKSQDLIYNKVRRARSLATLTGLIQVLGSSGSDKVFKYLVKMSKNKKWEIKFAVIKALEKMRQKRAVGVLVDMVQREKGRLLEDAGKALEKLTGLNYADNAIAWESWWNASKDTFNIEEVKRKKKRKKQQNIRGTVSYYGIRLISKNIIFIIDISGSMKGEKLQKMKEELVKAIKGLKPKARFNIIAFSSSNKLWNSKTLVYARNKSNALKFVENLSAHGGTATYDAIEKAFEIRGADTIFLLTDGAPSAGKFVKHNEILTAVSTLNKGRNIKIHTIGVKLRGKNRKFLKRLAKQNFGTSVQVK